MLKNGKSLDFRRFSGIEKAHRNSIEIMVGFMAESKGFFGALPCTFASLRSLTTSAKTVHRTVFFCRLRLLPPCSNPTFCFAKAKSRPCDLLFVLANDSNFDRNRVRGAITVWRGCIFDVRGCSSRFEGVHYSTREDSNKPQALKPAVFSFLLGLTPRFLYRPGI